MRNPFESQGVNKGGRSAQTVTGFSGGLRGVFRTLAQQHHEVGSLIERVMDTDDPGRRLELWTQIRQELLAHERGELDVVYPAFREHAELAHIAEEHANEASELEAAIHRLDGIDSSTRGWLEQFETVSRLVQHHVDEEENEWFPEASKVLGTVEAEELDDRFKARKERADEQID